MAVTRCGSMDPSKGSPKKASFPALRTPASGSQWTRSATKNIWKICGIQVRLPGRCGNEPGLLESEAGFSNRPHWIQGRMALRMAAAVGSKGHRVFTGAADHAESLRATRASEANVFYQRRRPR